MESETEIWRRVRQNTGLRAEDFLLPDQLMNRIESQRELAALMTRTARRLRGRDGQTLQRMAAEMRRTGEELATLSYLLTGRRLRRRQPTLPPEAPLPEELRILYHRLRRSSEGFRDLARDFAAYEEEFRVWSKAADQCVRGITQILRGKLHTD